MLWQNAGYPNLTPDMIARAAQLACALEVSADKPGNVGRRNDFHDAHLVDFLASAVAIGPAFQGIARASVGEVILQAARDTRQLVSSNTNLGIILLLAPMAKAATVEHPQGLRASVARVLEGLTVGDARLAYEAIRIATPAGMGKVDRYDVHETEVDITLQEAMRLAQDRDSVAREYVTDFEITFELGYPTLLRCWEKGHSISGSIIQAALTILAQVPDMLIARKEGLAVAKEVSRQAGQVLQAGGAFSQTGQKRLREFDRSLRDERHRLNPGTTADLVAAALFVFLIEGGGLEVFPEVLSRWAQR